MKTKKQVKIKKEAKKQSEQKFFLFGKRNYIIMLVGLGFIVVGYILMAGGGSDDPKIFNPAMYNFKRIRLAPTLVLIGLAIQIYAIMTKPKK